MRINRYFGRSLCFDNGFSVGFNWIHGNGASSKTSAILAGYHPRNSITWLWALDWNRPTDIFTLPKFSRFGRKNGYGSVAITMPIVGGFTFRWQPRMSKENPHD